jgi:hypothetical protein
MIALDAEILITLCEQSAKHRLATLNVDDFIDPSEAEITSEEIHLTILGRKRIGASEHLVCCFKLSTVSARQLVEELTTAITKREEAKP